MPTKELTEKQTKVPTFGRETNFVPEVIQVGMTLDEGMIFKILERELKKMNRNVKAYGQYIHAQAMPHVEIEDIQGYLQYFRGTYKLRIKYHGVSDKFNPEEHKIIYCLENLKVDRVSLSAMNRSQWNEKSVEITLKPIAHEGDQFAKGFTFPPRLVFLITTLPPESNTRPVEPVTKIVGRKIEGFRSKLFIPSGRNKQEGVITSVMNGHSVVQDTSDTEDEEEFEVADLPVLSVDNADAQPDDTEDIVAIPPEIQTAKIEISTLNNLLTAIEPEFETVATLKNELTWTTNQKYINFQVIKTEESFTIVFPYKQQKKARNSAETQEITNGKSKQVIEGIAEPIFLPDSENQPAFVQLLFLVLSHPSFNWEKFKEDSAKELENLTSTILKKKKRCRRGCSEGSFASKAFRVESI